MKNSKALLGLKIAAPVLILYSIIGGFLGKVPAQFILHESIRNLYFHVPMWFSMMAMMTISIWHSIRYLSSSSFNNDVIAAQSAHTGMLLGAMGLVTGSIWARYTWGAWWVPDTKLNGAAITMLIYLAYFILRGSVDEEQKRARLAAVSKRGA